MGLRNTLPVVKSNFLLLLFFYHFSSEYLKCLGFFYRTHLSPYLNKPVDLHVLKDLS